MAIIGSLPYTLQNGQTADATQVMADFNKIITDTNANAATAGANSNITSLTGLLTPLSLAQGGTGVAGPPVSFTTTAAGTLFSLISTDAGATSGPDLELYRNSASPAANDVISAIFGYGKDSAGNKQEYWSLVATILDATSTTEDAQLVLNAVIAGAKTAVLTIGPGFQLGASPTGGDKGAGTVNTAVADYVGGRPYSPISIGDANFTLTASVGASALTIALKGLNGSDPSATNPVFVAFRNATAATGDSTDITVTAATSLVVSSGSTLGTANNTAFRLWIIAFNDAGTFRLGVVNTLSGTSIMSLSDGRLLSSTAEGGAGGADSAQVIYTGTAVASKAMRLLGWLEWSSGLGTAGTWSGGPTTIQLFGPGNKKPGDTVQIVRNDTGAVATGTTLIPADDTIPQITEGDQYMTQAITPTATPNLLRVSIKGTWFTGASNNYLAAALFQDATANALTVANYYVTMNGGILSNFTATIPVEWSMLAATTSSTTFRIRAGSGGAGTTVFNGVSGSTRQYGGVMNSFMQVEEIMV